MDSAAGERGVTLLEPDAVTAEQVARLGPGVRVRVIDDAHAYSPPSVLTTTQVLVLGPRVGPDRARGVVTAMRAGGCVPRVVRVAAEGATPARLGEGFTDAVVLQPVSADALAAALDLAGGATQGPEVDAVETTRLSSLTGSIDEAMQHAVEVLRDAFHADGAVITRGSATWSDGVAPLGSEAAASLAARLSYAAAEETVLVGGALAYPDSASDHESYEAVAMIGDNGEPAGVIGLLTRSFRRLDLGRRRLLSSLAKRFGRELELRLGQQRLVAELDALREVGGLDPLTGAWSEATMLRLVDMLIAASQRMQVALSVAVVDLCGLERINQRSGHAAGDAALKLLGELTGSAVRAHDVVARYRGGLALVLPGAGASEAVRIASRLQRHVAEAPLLVADGETVALQLRAGVAEVTPDCSSAGRLLARAAKAAGEARRQPDLIAKAPTAVPLSAGATPRLSSGGGRTQSYDSGPGVAFSADLTGLTLGGTYRLLHRIASGGGGTVYRGEDLGLRRPVAVKLLSPELAGDETALDRFRNEASTLAAIRHPNLVQVYAFGVDRGFCYFVMELVEGESVEGALRRCVLESRTIPTSRLARIVEDVAAALEVLHSFSVLHRDLKPANVLLDPFRNRAVLVDVGVARRRDSGDLYLAGTPAYMAPEVFLGTGIGPGVDVFGLAATVYEMLTLSTPWPAIGTVQEAAELHSLLPPRPVSELVPHLGHLDEVLNRGLHADSTERYRSAKAFAQDFLAALSQVTASSTPSPKDEGVVSSRTRTRPPPQWEVERGEGHTRLVVFRSFASILGAKELARWRTQLAREDAALAQALSPSAPPLAWFSTQTLEELLERCPGEGDASQRGRQLGRAAVRSTFRRFFPASAATLSPQSTLAALPHIWEQYHGWGRLEISSDQANRATVTVDAAPPAASMSWLTAGMLEQLLLLSGATQVAVDISQSLRQPSSCLRVELSWT